MKIFGGKASYSHKMMDENKVEGASPKQKGTKGEGEMSFWDHLEILRWAVFRVFCLFIVLFILFLWLMPYIFSDFILGATSDDFFLYRWLSQVTNGLIAFEGGFHAQIININLASQLMTHINMSLALALIVTFPYLIYEIWCYIRPALFPNELRHVRAAFAGGMAMFYIGCFIGYAIIFPITFRFLAEYELSPEIENQINLQSYIATFTMIILIMGLVFEMPLVAWLLSNLGLLRKEHLRHYRRHAIVGLLVLAAFITPTGDPFTLTIVFIPLYLLYEFSILVIKPSENKN